ncbi:ABC transporter ATP-binding protein [Zhouia amylolytica]|uniref:ABC transporter related protein n=1 Tax=Zhouia amylolytica AD3 TaxID=1286632 RepID=W2ULF8_9FLAO|nr:ABC transporter ATP-binding protein [Zhouia amylolytica]ETN94799.1 ABC transporter related protein [Zhouia amylolytica AD3]
MLAVKNISFAYENKKVLKRIKLFADQGENIAIVGESGCGKSTLLKIIYGLLAPENGEIYWNDQRLLGPDYNLVPGESFMKYVAQDFDLMPSITVEENIGKFLSNFYPGKKKKRTRELLQLVEMTAFAKTKARLLSGGQMQRVALAQAIAKEPEIILLDEPFSNIDNFRKNNLRRNLFNYFKQNNITCIVATHDNADSLSFADKTLILKEGKIVDQGSPETLYENPKNYYVASLFGEVNELPLSLFDSNSNGETILVYPHEIGIDKKSRLKATIESSFFKGSSYMMKATLDEVTLYFEHQHKIENGEKVCLSISEDLIEKRS